MLPLRRQIEFVFVFVLVTLLFSWPAYMNGGPIWFWDSFQYLTAPEHGLKAVFGIDLGPYLHDSWGEPIEEYASDIGRSEAVRAGRSVYYGTIVLILSAAFGFWGPIVFQGGLIAASVLLTLRLFTKHLLPAFALIGAILALFSSASWFSSYLMPDVLAATSLLGAVHLLVRWSAMAWPERLFWFALLAFGGLSHTSHLVTTCGLVLVWIVLGPILRQPKFWQGLLATLSAIAVIVAGEVLFIKVVEKQYGEEPIRPPFLAVRAIVDGPGLEYLEQNCPEVGFAFCDYVDRLDAPSNHILWSLDKETGVFNVADAETQRRMSDEQGAFLAEIFAIYPEEQVSASVSRVIEQLGKFSLSSLAYTDALRHRLDDYFPGDAGLRIRGSEFYTERVNLTLMSMPNYVAVAFGIIALAWAARRREPLSLSVGDEAHKKLLMVLTVMLIIGVLGNAATTGIFSGPRDRYQARVIWIIPFLGLAYMWVYFLEPRLVGAKQRREGRAGLGV